MTQGFPWYVPSSGPSGVLRWEQPCSGSAPGARLSKSSDGAARTGRRGRSWGLRMKRARQICSQSVAGPGFAGTVRARRRIPSARGAIPCARGRLRRPPSRLHVTWEGSCTLLSCPPSSSKDLPSPSCFLEPAAGLPCVSDCVGHPQLHSSPARAAPGLANGPLGLPAALGDTPGQGHQAPTCRRPWGVKEQNVATLSLLMTWLEMRILHLSGFPLYF